jgi:hypothetical protein
MGKGGECVMPKIRGGGEALASYELGVGVLVYGAVQVSGNSVLAVIPYYTSTTAVPVLVGHLYSLFLFLCCYIQWPR